MKGQRSAIGSLPETLGFDHGSTSSDAGIDQQICWNNMRNSAHNMLPDYLASTSHPGNTYLNMNQGGPNLSGWNVGEPSSSGIQNHVSHDERKTEYGWSSSSMVPCGGGGPVSEEQQYEPDLLDMVAMTVKLWTVLMHTSLMYQRLLESHLLVVLLILLGCLLEVVDIWWKKMMEGQAVHWRVGTYPVKERLLK